MACQKKKKEKAMHKTTLSLNMSRLVFNTSNRLLTRRTIAQTNNKRALFSTTIFRLNQQKNKTTHFGFRDVAEEEKESLGKCLWT